MDVEVRERPDGWRTLTLTGLVGANLNPNPSPNRKRREIMHGFAKFDRDGRVEPHAVPAGASGGIPTPAFPPSVKAALPQAPV